MKTKLHPFAVNRPSCLRFCCGLFVALILAVFSAAPAPAQSATFALGTTVLWEGPSAGSDSVVLAVTPPTGAWTATTNAPWLHLSTSNQSGAGSANVVFSYDVNPGATRACTLTIAGQTLTVTQAGSTYVEAGQQTAVVTAGLDGPSDLAVDTVGNVYIADTFHSAIDEWNPANGDLTIVMSSTNFNAPLGVALDGAGNVYIADTYNNEVDKWNPANSNLTILVSLGLYHPFGIALDPAGDIYIADVRNNAVKEWIAATSNVLTSK